VQHAQETGLDHPGAPLSTLSRSAHVCARSGERSPSERWSDCLPERGAQMLAAARPPAHVLSVSALAAEAAARAQVVNPDGKPANLPNTNNATVAGLAPLSQAVINPSMIAARPLPQRRALRPCARACPPSAPRPCTRQLCAGSPYHAKRLPYKCNNTAEPSPNLTTTRSRCMRCRLCHGEPRVSRLHTLHPGRRGS